MNLTVTLLATLSILLSSCFSQDQTVTSNDSDLNCIDQSNSNNEIACPTIYDPVCGCDNKTYSNSCYASINGAISYTEGECIN